MGSSDTECNKITSQLTPEKCFEDTVVLKSGDTHFFIPLMARDTPDCFDFATYSGAFTDWGSGYEWTQAQLFKADTMLTEIDYLTGPNEAIVELSLEIRRITCLTKNALKAGTVGNARPAGDDVSPEDVEEWKMVIADNIDMLEEKYGSQKGAAEMGLLSYRTIVVFLVVLIGIVFSIAILIL
eukprot:CAMPEP_0113895738 /NCGR_PEP_ID=MMETSP0780_2-20120614/17556_1 /TAXON_ID=652834 /ORGANISM="Palpitomonas bilix" /LENGTH=182 /DNA_ID=CAMNT_0000886655 /DNA_START=316 /DNA_END=864 /DNA_ORIENTATION=- /assembly_acc=CAM_ASM_000599